jgi:hypothetical protein
MSDSTERAAAVGPGVLEFGGRVFVISPVTGTDMMTIHAEFRRQCIALAKDPLELCNERIAAAEKAERPFSPTVVNAMVTAAMSAAARKEAKSEPSDEEVLARLHTLEGSQAVVWLRLLKADPSIKRAWVAEHMPDMDARNRVFTRLAEIDGLRGIDPKKASATG